MKIPNFAGTVRRSQMVTTYGPGAIVNLKSPRGCPISAVTSGLDFWDLEAKPAGLKNRQKCFLSRLQKKLDVDGFRLPPVSLDTRFYIEETPLALPAKRFPDWLTCPKCYRLKHSNKWQKSTTVSSADRWCGRCSSKKEKVFVVPVRFILSCENGHLTEFPWVWWLKTFGSVKAYSKTKDDKVEDKKKIVKPEDCDHSNLRLLQRASLSLASLNLYCDRCESSASMGAIFDPTRFDSFDCGGERPWLGENAKEPCDKNPVAVQRNSTSLYLPKYESALDIPPWTHTLEEKLGDWWVRLNKLKDSASRLEKIKVMIDDVNDEQGTNYSAEDLNNEIQELIDLDENSDPDLRVDEYKQFLNVDDTLISINREFRAREREIDNEISSIIIRVLSLERLREVRANYGFARLKNHNPECRLSSENKNWLPAIEVKGEGIFFQLDREYISKWSANEVVRERARVLNESYQGLMDKREVPNEERIEISPKFVVLHTLSHLVLREISYECGYSAASLRERLYCSDDMEGVLIYTSTPDSEGTMGGLSRLAMPERFTELIKKTFINAEWCSSDPLCIEGVSSHSEPCNLSACHACMMLPETSCEYFNLYLDRALVVGMPELNLPELFQFS